MHTYSHTHHTHAHTHITYIYITHTHAYSSHKHLTPPSLSLSLSHTHTHTPKSSKKIDKKDCPTLFQQSCSSTLPALERGDLSWASPGRPSHPFFFFPLSFFHGKTVPALVGTETRLRKCLCVNKGHGCLTRGALRAKRRQWSGCLHKDLAGHNAHSLILKQPSEVTRIGYLQVL